MRSACGASADSCLATSRPRRSSVSAGTTSVTRPIWYASAASINLSGEQEPQGAAFTHEARQALGAPETGNDPECHLRLAEFGPFGGEAQVAGHGEFHTTTQGKALNQCDRRLRESLYLPEDQLAGL